MSHTPILSPTHPDNHLLILEGVLQGVVDQGAKYGLTHPRRDLLALTLQVLLRSLREGWEAQFAILIGSIQAGRPSQPASARHGDPDLSTSTPKLSG